MTMTKFWKWTLLFGIAGLFVPVVVTLSWFAFHIGMDELVFLWPSSIMFMGLGALTPMSTVIFIYALAFIENVIPYAVVGALTWPIGYFVLRLCAPHTPKSS